MSNIELAAATKEEIVAKLQLYFTEELQLEIGSFDAQFLLDFLSERVGNYYYNQGLTDELKALENKIEEFSDTVYQLEKDTNPAKK